MHISNYMFLTAYVIRPIALFYSLVVTTWVFQQKQ